MAGVNGSDHLSAQLSPAEAATAGSPGGLGLDLTLKAAKPPVLEGGGGWIDFGPAGGSYYYSRTDLLVSGSIVVGGHTLQVDGTAWFDHQWGDFIAVGGGGWDWFAVNLADGTDLTLSLVRAADGTDSLVYGTLVDARGRATHLDRSAFSVAATAHWTSPVTGVTYPAGWTVSIPGQALEITLRPTVAGQELDTRATTGVDLLGGLAGGHGRPRRHDGRRRRLRRADGLRPGQLSGARGGASPRRPDWRELGTGVGAPGRLIPALAASWNSAARLAGSRSSATISCSPAFL